MTRRQFSREFKTEPVLPGTYFLAADVDATLKQRTFDLPQRKQIADVHHHREANYLGRTVEIPQWILHCRTLRNAAPRLKPIQSDNAPMEDRNSRRLGKIVAQNSRDCRSIT